MGLTSLAAEQPKRPGGTVGAVLEEMSQGQRDLFHQLLEDGGYSDYRLASALQDDGHHVSHNHIAHYRRKYMAGQVGRS